jgi:hypothetical protein
MEILLQTETKNYSKLRDILLKDDLVSRASIVFKEAKTLSKEEGYYCYISGTEDQCKKAVELAKDLAKEIKDKEEIINKIKEEEEKAEEGFGGIFG